MSIKTLKAPILFVLITLGIFLQYGSAQSAEARAYFAGGCFWCVESDFEHVDGVREVISGYTGGSTPNPTYKKVSKGGTGHYEAVEVRYDPEKVSYDELVHIFFRTIDPLDSGGQFCDRGDSYRTAVFVTNSNEQAAAQRAKSKAQQQLGKKIVTPILQKKDFYPAEEHHQDYYKRDDIVLTRRGPKAMKNAYKFYRKACGRDKRVRELWGKDAPFAG